MDKSLYIIKLFLSHSPGQWHGTDTLFEGTDPVSKVYFVLKDYYQTKKDPLSVDDLVVLFHTAYPFIRDKEKEIYSFLFDKLRTIEAKPELVEEYIKSIEKLRAATLLAQAAMDYGHGKEGSLDTLIASFGEAVAKNERIPENALRIVSTDLERLCQSQVLGKGLKWRLRPLNQSLGPLRKGDFGFIFARPETGKTTFLADQVAFFLEQLAQDQGPILWWNNEEQSEKVMLRIYQAFFGVTLTELLKHSAHYSKEFQERTKNKIILIDEHLITMSMIEEAMERYGPSLTIFDQIDKIEVREAERRDLMLGTIYQKGRQWAKKYCPVIGVCQSDGSGENVMWLTMGNVADAKTSKQAEADFIIGIGKVHSPGQEFVRYINVSKNKLLGDEHTEEIHRHLQIPVRILPEVARYQEI